MIAPPATLQWFPELGFGFFPVRNDRAPYDAAYWDKYRGYADTELGAKLTAARLAFVRKHWDGSLCDIGIGSGQFVEAAAAGIHCHDTTGYDINPVAVRWLCGRGLYRDPHVEPVEAFTFWDSLEHLADPWGLAARASRWLFISIPIFRDVEHVLASKHFRRDEHYWYFTREALVRELGARQFDLRDWDGFESRLGREDILSFAFERRPGL